MRAPTRYAASTGIAITLLLAFPLTARAAEGASFSRHQDSARDGRVPAAVAVTRPDRPAVRHVRSIPLSSRPTPALHDIHLTYSRVLIDGGSIFWRVRLFRDDLEKALRTHARAPELTTTTPGADSIFAAYFNGEVPVDVNGTRITAKVVESGRDADATDQDMWWYLLELSAVPPVRTLTVRVGLLFQHFADQRNIVTVLKSPSEERRSMYFVRDDPKGQTLEFP